MTMDDITAKPNPFNFEPLQDLSADTEPKIVEQPLSETDKLFKQTYEALAQAEKEQDPEAYAKGMRELIGAMKTEITKQFMTSSGDLGHTMQEWANKSPYPDSTTLELLKKGQNITKRTNTLNNSQTPHGSGMYRGDQTDRINSQAFGGNVVDYVTERGSGYITAQIVPGQPVQMEPVSVFQVETTLNGYHPRPKQAD